MSQNSGALVVTGGLGVGGNLYCGSTFNMSDASLKEGMEPISEPWNLLDRMRGYTFWWNNHPENQRFGRCGQRAVGCRAQDIRDAGEYGRLCVSEDPATGLLAVDYTKLVPLLMEGMHSLREQCNRLEDTLRDANVDPTCRKRRRSY